MPTSETKSDCSNTSLRTGSIVERPRSPVQEKHNFEITTFSKPTYCDLCSSFIWGVVKQGYSCTDCGYNAHKKCQLAVSTPCNPVHYHAPQKSLDRNSIDRPSHSLVTELFAETHAQSKKLENALQDANPALNMAVFMKQNNRFTARQKPLIWLNEQAIKLITWQSVPNTLMFLLCYILICLHPILIPILPQLVLLYLIIRFYHYRADSLMNGHPLPKPHTIGHPPKLSPSAGDLKQAFQNIQNTMAKMSDLYDAGYNLYRMIDWSDPDVTQDVLVKIVASMGATLFVISVVPLQYLALVGGIGVFIANTAIFKALGITLAPILVQNLQKRVERVRSLIHEARATGNDAIIDVVVFENQRWWAGAGWISSLLPDERPPWSDETGKVTFPSKQEFPLPSLAELTDQEGETGACEWADQWKLDTHWTGVDDEGWEYTNQKWQNPRPNRIIGSFTRRRRWVRHLRLVETPK